MGRVRGGLGGELPYSLGAKRGGQIQVNGSLRPGRHLGQNYAKFSKVGFQTEQRGTS